MIRRTIAALFVLVCVGCAASKPPAPILLYKDPVYAAGRATLRNRQAFLIRVSIEKVDTIGVVYDGWLLDSRHDRDIVIPPGVHEVQYLVNTGRMLIRRTVRGPFEADHVYSFGITGPFDMSPLICDETAGRDITIDDGPLYGPFAAA